VKTVEIFAVRSVAKSVGNVIMILFFYIDNTVLRLSTVSHYLFGTKDRTFLITYTPKGIPTAIKRTGATSAKIAVTFPVNPVVKPVGNVIIFLDLFL